MKKRTLFNPIEDLEQKARLKKHFRGSVTVSDPEAQTLFSNFVLAWEPVLDFITQVRESGRYDIGDSQLRGRIYASGDEGLRRIHLLIGFTEQDDTLQLENAGLVLSAPFARIAQPDLFFDDYKLGLGEGTFTKMKEDDARLAVRYCMNVMAVRDYHHKFPGILSPMRERMIFENLNAWIADQVHITMTQPTPMNHEI